MRVCKYCKGTGILKPKQTKGIHRILEILASGGLSLVFENAIKPCPYCEEV